MDTGKQLLKRFWSDLSKVTGKSESELVDELFCLGWLVSVRGDDDTLNTTHRSERPAEMLRYLLKEKRDGAQ